MIAKICRGIYKFLLLLFLFINMILLARVLGYFYLPGEETPLVKAKQAAETVITYSEELASSYGLENHREIADILAKFKYEIEKAENTEEAASLMLDYGRQTQDVIFRVLQEKKINTIFSIINKQELPESGKITISKLGDEMKILDPDGIVTEETREQLQEISFNQTLEIEIVNGKAELVPTGDIFNQVNYLQTKVASLERQLLTLEQKAGYQGISGKGIIILVYDEDGNTESTGIVHDQDIRNIINELKIAGAYGIEVGGQRLTVNSAVRCVGPTMLVNNQPISVNPIIIKAVGNPEVLKSSLDIIKNQLENFGIVLEIHVEDDLLLSGQSNYER
ncbi:MAG: DUF881 domain-containing protein [Halanaerobiaceae bacterium]|nr:DUF881 domain-containing protein [Halanaerobiaceae bacterium]